MRDLEIYIHIPFCAKKCSYCDFLSEPSDTQTMKRYVKALKEEIKLNKNRMEDYEVSSVFIGGGTPSILDEELIKEIICTLQENTTIKKNAEITIECNPGTVNKKRLKAYKEYGINRLSFGLQSADNDELKMLGRIHTYEQFLQSYELARECGFHNINIDIMSAIPKQTIKSYKETLKKVIDLNPEHISAYSLIVEDGTLMKEMAEENPDILPDEDIEREMYYLTKEMLEKAGYHRYEISNYAKEGLECRHNSGYWKRTEYLGFGVGAASLYKNYRITNTSDINEYMNRLEAVSDWELHYILGSKNELIDISEYDESKEDSIEILSTNDEMSEFMFLGLRMTQGISKKEFQSIFGAAIYEIFGKQIAKLIEQKLLEEDEEMIKLTEKGIDISNHVMSEFIFDRASVNF